MTRPCFFDVCIHVTLMTNVAWYFWFDHHGLLLIRPRLLLPFLSAFDFTTNSARCNNSQSYFTLLGNERLSTLTRLRALKSHFKLIFATTAAIGFGSNEFAIDHTMMVTLQQGRSTPSPTAAGDGGGGGGGQGGQSKGEIHRELCSKICDEGVLDLKRLNVTLCICRQYIFSLPFCTAYQLTKVSSLAAIAIVPPRSSLSSVRRKMRTQLNSREGSWKVHQSLLFFFVTTYVTPGERTICLGRKSEMDSLDKRRKEKKTIAWDSSERNPISWAKSY